MHIFPCAIRVSLHNTARVNRRAQEDMMDRLRRYEHADECRLKARLHELDCEWDTERAFEGGASALVLVGATLGAVHSRKWLLFSAAAGMLMLERALRGWCPMQPVLRRLGVRTAGEIAAEKDAIRDILAQRAEEVKAEAQPEEGE